MVHFISKLQEEFKFCSVYIGEGNPDHKTVTIRFLSHIEILTHFPSVVSKIFGQSEAKLDLKSLSKLYLTYGYFWNMPLLRGLFGRTRDDVFPDAGQDLIMF